MYNTPNLVLISLLLVVAIIAVGSLLFINTRPEVSPTVNLESPLTLPVTEPTPDPTPNNQVFLPTTTSLLPTSLATTLAKTEAATAQANNNNNNDQAVPAPSPTSNVSSNPANVNNENENNSNSELVTVSNNVTPLTLTEIQRLSIDDIRKALFVHTLYIQNVYNLKAENGWTAIDSYSDVNIETAINNYKLIINQLRVMGLLSEVDFYKAMGYSEIYYNCSINPNSSQCSKNYTLDGELPLRYDPTYKDLNYTFDRYESEIILPELNRLQREGRRYDFKYLQLRTGEDKAVYNSTVTQASSENNTNNSPAANNGATNNQGGNNAVNNSGNNGVNQSGNNAVNNAGNNAVNNSGNNGVNNAGNNDVNNAGNNGVNNAGNNGVNNSGNNGVNNSGNNGVNNTGNNSGNNGVNNSGNNGVNQGGNNQANNGAGNNQSENQAPAPAPTESSVNGNPF